MTDARLTLFGSARLEPGAGRPRLTSRKGLALLAYLALEGGHHGRTALAALLWPDRPRTDGLTNLRRVLYRVRASLGPEALEVTADALALRPDRLETDVHAFRAACEEASRAVAAGRDRLRMLGAAVALCPGELLHGLRLPGCEAFAAWLATERERQQEALAGLLEQLADDALRGREPAIAMDAARRWLALDPLSEAAHRALMRAHAQSGDITAALEQYRRCRALLEGELGLPPEAATEALYRALRSGAPLPADEPAATAAAVRYVRSGDVHIAYQVVGNGPVDLIVAPGFVSHLEHLWRSPPLRAVLSRLAGSTRLILFDRRGVGLSERVAAPPTLHATARDIDAVLRAVGSPGAIVFGFSEGGPAALLYAVLHPQRVRGLLLYGTMAKGLRAPDYPWALDGPQFDRWLERLVASWGRVVPHEAFAPSYVDDGELWSWYAELLRLGSSPGGLRAVLGAMRDLDVRSLLPHVQVPTLLLQRVGDRVARVGAGRFLAAHLPAARYLELDGDEHWWWLGGSDVFLEAVEAFVSEVPSHPPAGRLRTVTCARDASEPPRVTTFEEPLAALAATGGGVATGRAVVHCASADTEPERVASELLSAARPGQVVVGRRVRDVALAVGYGFERADAHPAALAAGEELWVVRQRPG